MQIQQGKGKGLFDLKFQDTDFREIKAETHASGHIVSTKQKEQTENKHTLAGLFSDRFHPSYTV